MRKKMTVLFSVTIVLFLIIFFFILYPFFVAGPVSGVWYSRELDCLCGENNRGYVIIAEGNVFLCHVAHGTYRFLGTCYPEDDHSYLFTQDVHRENQESGQVMFRLFPRMNRMLFQYREGGYCPMTVTLKRVTTTPEGRALFASFCRFRQEKTE